MHWWLVSYVGIVITGMVIATVQNFFCLDASGWASWVQAIGSIGAIAGAYALAVRQERIQSDRANAEERQALGTLAFSAAFLARDAATAVRQASRAIQGHKGGSVFDHPVGNLEDAQYALRTLLGRPLKPEIIARVVLLQREVTNFLRLLEQLNGQVGPFTDAAVAKVRTSDGQAFTHSFHISNLASREYPEVWTELLRENLFAEV